MSMCFYTVNIQWYIATGILYSGTLQTHVQNHYYDNDACDCGWRNCSEQNLEIENKVVPVPNTRQMLLPVYHVTQAIGISKLLCVHSKETGPGR